MATNLPWQAWNATRSVSGQFLVRDNRTAGMSRVAAAFRTNSALLALDPDLLAISCERIREEVWERLGFTPPWKGRICVTLSDAEVADADIVIGSDRYRDGSLYSIALPDIVAKENYLRALVQIVLQELANRNSSGHDAEVPPWLAEGLVRHIIATKGIEVMLAPPQKLINGLTVASTSVVIKEEQSMEWARTILRAHSPISFQDLSWPDDSHGLGQTFDLYGASAQVFVAELLSLPDGRARLKRMVSDLPSYYNWQFAFLGAFEGKFARLVDVEKWWSLRLVRFTGIQSDQKFPFEKFQEQLDDLLSAQIEVRTEKSELPLHARVTFQAVMEKCEPEKQLAILGDRLQAIEFTRLRAPREVGGLLADYSAALSGYLARLKEQPGIVKRLLVPGQNRSNKEDTIKKLDVLDIKRGKIKSGAREVVDASAAGNHTINSVR